MPTCFTYKLLCVFDRYLLEKVRILLQAPGERNYHVFYQILFGSTLNELDKFYLSEKSPEDFVMTSKSGTYDRRDGVSDIEMYEQLRTGKSTCKI